VTLSSLARLPLLAGAVLSLYGQAIASEGSAFSVTQQARWSDGDRGLTLDLRFPEPQVEDLDGQLVLRLAGEGFISEPGAPDLPLVNRLVRIPDRSGVTLEVLAETWQPWQHAVIRPVQERLHTAADLPLPWAEQAVIYQGNTTWPAGAISVGEPMILRDQRLVTVSVAPLRWNPATGLVERLESLELRLAFEGENPLNQITQPMPPSPLMASLVGGEIIAPPAAPGALEDIAWSSPVLPLNYLVMTPASALDNVRFNDWLDWKHRKGHHVTVVSSNDISWTSTAIRNRIISEYTGADPPDYVMLVGDVDGGSYVTPSHSSQFDHYYAAIAGNDILADVVVGRISARSATQLSTIFNKILAYEQDPDLDNSGWLHRASFLTGQGHCGLSMSQLSRAAAFSLVDHYGYTQIDTAFCASSPSYVANWYNSGTSFHNYRGWIGMEGLSTSQIMGLAQGRRTPISVIFTCSSGDFADSWSEPAYTEAFLRAGTATTPGGGAAAMGFCTPQTHTAYNNVVCGGFWYSVLDLRIRQVGTAMFRGKYELFRSLPNGDSNISNFSYWANLMGDPGMNVWVGEPSVLQITQAPVSMGAADSRIEAVITTTAGDPVEGAVVCASQRDGFRVLGLSGPDGHVVLALPALDPQLPLWLTATRDDHVPALMDYTLGAASATPTVSNPVYSNGISPFALPGSVTSLNLTVHNPLGQPMSGGQVSLALDEGRGTVQQAVANLPVIPAGQSATLVSPLQFTAAPDVSSGSPLYLDLTLGWTGGTPVTHRLMADLRYPRLELLDPNAGNLQLSPGNNGNLQLELLNGGELAGVDLTLLASFPEDSPFTATTDPVVLDLAAGASTDQVFIPIALSSNAFRGSRSTLRVDWTGNGASGHFELPVSAATGVATDPTGPDAYGYMAWEDSDNGPLSMPYAWIEIAPAAGGGGTVLNLTDLGDEQDDATLVTLPFAFTLYGESYTEMSVCSNGFVSFGPDSHLETDFRNHYLPGAMGPEPMLAVMWDDHKITNGAQVCVQYLPDTHMYVVEWYRVRGNSTGGPNSFQLLLLDPAFYVTPTGDGEFVYQYHTFLNNQNNSQDFPYCTIGVEDHTGTRGLTFTNYNTWFPTATNITGTRSIRFSTLQQAVSGGVLEVLASEVELFLGNQQAQETQGSIPIRNAGSGLLNWTASLMVPGDWPPAPSGRQDDSGRDQGGPDVFGYRWIDSLEEDGPVHDWVDTSAGAEPVSFAQNDQAEGPFAIGFPMPFYGALYDSLYISPNGFLSFTDTANYWNNSVGLPNSLAPDNAICGWWDDLLNNDSLEGHVTRYQGADSLVVSWLAAPHYNPGQYGGPFTFQIILESNGRITLQYGDMGSADANSDSGTIGVQGNTADQGFSVRHMLLSRSNYTVRIDPPFWLTLPSAGGLLGAGQEGEIALRATNAPGGSLLPDGAYQAVVVITSGDQEFQVPVILEVGEVGVDGRDGADGLPGGFALGQAWPNPFNPVTRVQVEVPDNRPFELSLYNLRGQRVRTLYSGSHTPGRVSFQVDGSALASGVYLLQLDSPTGASTRKLMLIK
jgi:hypothetical protein